MLTLQFVLTILFLTCVLAVPSRRSSGLSVPLIRANQGRKTLQEKAAWLRRQRDILITKYGSNNSSNLTHSISPRASGINDLVNHNQDSSYFGSLAIGTPAEAYNVILDTGSADLWVAASGCTHGCTGVKTYNANASSSFKNESTVFDITYGSGRAQGYLAKETVQMAGFSVPNQDIGVVESVSSGLLSTPVSGLLGLGFKTIASSQKTPFWQTLVESGAWSEPVMSFFLSRFLNATHAKPEEPGGRFTMGFMDPSLYTGQVEFIDIPTGQEGYWILPLTAVNVDGQSMNLPDSAQSSYSAIDTGTTLIGGPPDIIKEIFASIPGSAPGTGDYEGYYTYPCDHDVHISLTFGSGSAWSIDPADFMLTQVSPKECVGAMFSLDTSDNSSGPSWIVGDTFLKNVYSVFRYTPASVGFAKLSTAAHQLAQEGGNLPTPTTGAHPIVATGGASSSSLSQLSVISFATVLSTVWALF